MYVLKILFAGVSLTLGSLCLAATARVTLSEDLSVIEVRYEAASGALEAQDRAIWDAITILKNARRSGRRLVPLHASEPVVYRVDLRHSGPQWGISRWHAPLRMADWHDWLLTPVAWEITKPLDLYIQVPDEGDVTMPFERLQEVEGYVRYRAYPVLPGHGGLTLFGNLETRVLHIGDSRIELSVTGDGGEEAEKLFAWAEDIVMTAVDVHGASPGDASVMLVPVPLVSGVVPWAHVRRGGGSHIIAYVKEGLHEEELYEDWTLFHEVTHLYHPYLHSGGRWVSEGLASYYQNIYRARAGVVTPEYAYEQLLSGLDRGRRENTSAGNRPVTQGGRMRTYWTGAALALQADARLQENETGELALAIGRFAENNMPEAASWHPRDYLAALDREVAEPVLVRLYDSYVRDRFFPEPEMASTTWQKLFKSK